MVTAASITSVRDIERLAQGTKSSAKMPLLFVGHGNPMNAIENNQYSEKWENVGRELPTPKAILSVSAHWLTRGVTKVTAMQQPKTIHDFGGFPQELFDVQYPAPGSPELAKQTQSAITKRHVYLDDDWGFDHGTWSVLKKMYPKADIPVLQLSIDYGAPMEEHYALGQALSSLREKGVLIMGSGNVVHNLRAIRMDGKTYDWAEKFDEFVRDAIEEKNDQTLINFQKQGEIALLAHPTYDHYLPLLYTIGARRKDDTLSFFNEGMDLGSASMRSIIYS
jgi:4,5-DOPA dioxygenase extradiol